MRYYSVHTFMGNINRIGQSGVGAMQHAGYRLNGLTAQIGFAKPDVDVEYGANGRARGIVSKHLIVTHDTLSPKNFEPGILPFPLPRQPAPPVTLKPQPDAMALIDLLPKEPRPIVRTSTIINESLWSATYGPGGQHMRTVERETTSFRQEISDGSGYNRDEKSTITTRYYAPSFERTETSGQTVDYTYINSPNGLIAAVKTSGSKHDAMLLATDHLGSIIGVWNTSGTPLEA